MVPSGRKRGGQPGHRGAFRALLPVEQVNEIVAFLETTVKMASRGRPLSSLLPAAQGSRTTTGDDELALGCTSRYTATQLLLNNSATAACNVWLAPSFYLLKKC